jgi:SAM-dependent methyltransferase
MEFGTGWTCEIGPGNSLWAEIMPEIMPLHPAPLHRLILLDSSSAMLEHSKSVGAAMVIADAIQLPLHAESIETLVALVGDSYNLKPFWREAERVLKPGGSMVFTVPSFKWASAFRASSASGSSWAEFQVVNGRQVLVPSFILDEDDQHLLIEPRGLVVKKIEQVKLSALDGMHISPKLSQCLSSDDPVVTGYYVIKPL